MLVAGPAQEWRACRLFVLVMVPRGGTMTSQRLTAGRAPLAAGG